MPLFRYTRTKVYKWTRAEITEALFMLQEENDDLKLLLVAYKEGRIKETYKQ